MSLFKKINAKHIPNVDLVKFIMAIFVVVIHTHPYTCIENAKLSFFVQKLISLSVPYFFVTSGFLLWRKIANSSREEKLQRIRNWIIKLIKLYSIWTLIYLPFTIYGYVISDLSPLKGLLIFVRNFLFVGENMYSWPLWYLLAMIVAGFILYVMVYFNHRNQTMYITALVLLLIGHLLDKFKGYECTELYYLIFYTTRNGFFVGLQYIILGQIVASSGVLDKRLLVLLLLGGFILQDYGVFFASYIIAYALFSLVCGIKVNISTNISNKARISSTVIYFVHMIFVGSVTISQIIISPFYLFLGALIFSLATSMYVTINQRSEIIKVLFE